MRDEGCGIVVAEESDVPIGRVEGREMGRRLAMGDEGRLLKGDVEDGVESHDVPKGKDERRRVPVPADISLVTKRGSMSARKLLGVQNSLLPKR